MSLNIKVKKRKVELNALQDKKESSAAKDKQLEDMIGILVEKLKSWEKEMDNINPTWQGGG